MSFTEAQYRALLATQQHARTPQPTLPSLQVRYPEEVALRHLQAIAEAHGWMPEFSWNPHGRFAGLGCWFVRGTSIVYVQILREGTTVSRDQQAWLDALAATGTVETRVQPLTSLEALFRRLQAQEGT